jgi:hypothetical protein
MMSRGGDSIRPGRGNPWSSQQINKVKDDNKKQEKGYHDSPVRNQSGLMPEGRKELSNLSV